MDPAYPTTFPSPKDRFSQIDSLRAVACVLVIIFHAGVSSPSLHEILVHTFGIGTVGVVIFFAISGFVIPDSLAGGRWHGVKRFAIRRFWRLYPPFWIALLLTCWIDSRYDTVRMPWDAVMLPTFGPPGNAFRHFWTLEVELLFYFSITALFFAWGHLRWKALLPGYLLFVVLALKNSVLKESLSNYDAMLEYLAVMFWGGLCRKILHFEFPRGHWLAPKCSVNWARASVLGLSTAILMISHLVKGVQLGWLVSISGFLLWGILTPVRSAWLTPLGRWTYSTYLLHNLVLTLARPTLGLTVFKELSNLPLCFAGLCLLLSFAVGALAYRWIEKPSDWIGKQLTKNQPQSSADSIYNRSGSTSARL